jgi:hypothetical protein
MMNVGLDHRDVDPQLDVVFDRGLNHRIIDGLTQRQSVGDPRRFMHRARGAAVLVESVVT